jgi:Rieske 2Fe-2S protein
MTEPPRIDRLMEPAIVGRIYLVPTVRAEWPHGDEPDDWPVIGPKHNDVEFLNFERLHCHVDARFVRRRTHRRVVASTSWQGIPRHEYFLRPLSHPPLPDIVWKPLTMLREMPAYPFHDEVAIKAIAEHYAGRQCEHGKGGWICPHRKASLGSLAPVDGVITCPLHGLRIDAASGRVLT